MAVKDIVFPLIYFLSIIYAQDVASPITHGKVVACYYKPNNITFPKPYDDEKLSLCTHLVIENGYVDITNYTIAVDYINTSQLIDFISEIKRKQIHLNVTMTIKIGYETNVFSVPSNQTMREQLIESAVARVREYDLDGLDLYVSDLPETREEADNLVRFAQDLKETLVFSFNLIVTATFVGRNKLASSTNLLVNLSRYLNHIHIPTSDVIITSQRLEYTIAPLRGRDESDDSSVEFVIKHLLANGVKPLKLVLLLDLNPFFYLLTDPEMKDIRLEDLVVIDNKNAQDVYYGICFQRVISYSDSQWDYHWSESISARYFKLDEVIVFSENPRSIVAKVKMGVDYGLKGFALRSQFFTPCPSGNDTYIEFIKRYNKLKKDPFLLQKLKDLNLPNVDAEGKLDGKSYGILNNTLYFESPEKEKYQLNVFKTINQAITVTLEEKEILNALETNNKVIGNDVTE